MNNAQNLLGVLITLLILSSCKHYVPPKAEVCIYGDAGGICNDPRKPKGERDYILLHADMLNYIMTSPEDWDEQRQWWLDKLERLEKCERGLSNSKDKLKRTGIDNFK